MGHHDGIGLRGYLSYDDDWMTREDILYSPASKAIFAYPSQYLTADASSINSYTHNCPFLNMLAGIPVRLANSWFAFCISPVLLQMHDGVCMAVGKSQLNNKVMKLPSSSAQDTPFV